MIEGTVSEHMFNGREIDFLRSQPAMRLGTVSSDGQVDVSPVEFEFDGEAFYVGSSAMDKSHKGKNIATGNRLVSIVIDDLGPTDAREPRGI
jgi:pyridoxamine 5'-phosphate oxidase family protein